MNALTSKALLKKLKTHRREETILQKGFTLVELMIVIVIVGILSSVALPNFLSQASKAKGTECTTKAGAILSAYGADALGDATEALKTAVASAAQASDLCTFSTPAVAAAGTNAGALEMTVTGNGDIDGEYFAAGCVNPATGSRELLAFLAFK